MWTKNLHSCILPLLQDDKTIVQVFSSEADRYLATFGLKIQ